MANTVTTTTILDGSRILIVKIELASDGASGEETGTVVVDASTYTPAFTNAKLTALHSSLIGFQAELEWDATANTHLMHLPDYEYNYSRAEGMIPIPNNAGAGRTGDIVLNTTGFTAAGDNGTIILVLHKKDA